MLILDFDDQLKELNRYLYYFNLSNQKELFICSPNDKDWLDIVNNHHITKICYCFENVNDIPEKIKSISSLINQGIYQNLDKYIVFISKSLFANLPPHYNFPCFLITNLINDYDEQGNEKYVFGDDFYFQIYALFMIIKYSNGKFSRGSYYGITSAGLFFKLFSQTYEIISSVLSRLISDDNLDINDSEIKEYNDLKNSLDSQIKGFANKISLDKNLEFSKEDLISKIRSILFEFWSGKILSSVLNKVQWPKLKSAQGFIGEIRTKLINNISKIKNEFIDELIDLEEQAKKELSEIETKINEFNDNYILKLAKNKKKLYILLGVILISIVSTILIVPNIIGFVLLIIFLIVALILFYYLPKKEINQEIEDFYRNIENILVQKNNNFIKYNSSNMLHYFLSNIEKTLENISNKYDIILNFFDKINYLKEFNSKYIYWLDYKINSSDIDNFIKEQVNNLNIEVLNTENVYNLLEDSRYKIYSELISLVKRSSENFENNPNLIANEINNLSLRLSGKNLLKIVDNDKLSTEFQNYYLLMPDKFKTRLPLNFHVQETEFINSKDFIFLYWLEVYKEKNNII